MADNMGALTGRQPGIKSESVAPMGLPGNKDPKALLPTFIYDFFLKTRHPDLASAMLQATDLNVQVKSARPKTSPSGRDVNGINDGVDSEPKDDIARRIDGMPQPDLGEQLSNHSFLQDWFSSFWDVWSASKNIANNPNGNAAQYLSSAQRWKNPPMSMMAGGPMAAGRFMNGRYNPNLQRHAVNNMQMRGLGGGFPGNQLGPPGPDARPHSPMNGDNAPSPKRPRVEGGGFPNQAMGGIPGGPAHMANGQGPNMPPPGLDPSSLALMNNIPGGFMNPENSDKPIQNPQGGALADYQMQLMLLEQQNKRRLLMARQEQETSSGAAGAGPPGATAQPTMAGQQGVPGTIPPHPSLSPGRRGGQSPSPHDPMKRNQIAQSPRPDGLGGARESPAPGGIFEHQNPQMNNPQFFQNQIKQQMGPGGMIPGGGPGFQNPNGQMKGPMAGMQGQPAMQPNQFNQRMNPAFPQNPQQQHPPNGNNAQGNPQGNQQPNSMPPPSAPANLNATGRTNPSSPALNNQASPTPGKNSAANKKNQGKKGGPSTAKGGTSKKPGQTPNTEPQDSVPPAPTSTHPPNRLSEQNNRQGNSNQPPATPNGAPQPPPGGQSQPDINASQVPDVSMPDPNLPSGNDLDFDFPGMGSSDVLDGFDFESFLQVEGPGTEFGNIEAGFFAGDSMELGTENQ